MWVSTLRNWCKWRNTLQLKEMRRNMHKFGTLNVLCRWIRHTMVRKCDYFHNSAYLSFDYTEIKQETTSIIQYSHLPIRYIILPHSSLTSDGHSHSHFVILSSFTLPSHVTAISDDYSNCLKVYHSISTDIHMTTMHLRIFASRKNINSMNIL